MTAIVSVERAGQESGFFFRRSARRPPFRLSVQTAGGARVLSAVLTLTPRTERDVPRAEALLAALSEQGVCRVAASDDFPFWPLLFSFGLKRADAFPLYRRLAARLAVLAAERRGWQPPELHVALHGRTLSSDMAAAAETLCAHARTLSLCTERDTASFCLALRRRYGAAVFSHPPASQLARCGLHILFDPPAQPFCPSPDAWVLPLFPSYRPTPGGSARLSVRLRPPPPLAPLFPDNVAPEPLLSSLFSDGQWTPLDLEDAEITLVPEF